MTVSYENTTEDAAAWTAAYFTRTRPGRAAAKRMRILFPVLVAVLFPLYLLFLGGITGAEIPLTFLLFAALIGGVAGYLNQTLGARRRTRKAAAKLVHSGHFEQFLGPKEVSVLPQGLRTVWPDGETLLKWSGIKRVEEDGTHLHLFASETNFLTVPKRAFRSNTEERGFLALMERYRTAGELSTTAQPVATPLPAATNAAAVSPVPTTAPTTVPTTPHAPGAPWWRSRDSVDAGTTQVNRRA